MTNTAKFSLISVLSLLIAAPAAAQQPAHEGDYYAPSTTMVQQPTPQESSQARQGDYYAPGKTIVQQPTPQETKQFEQGDYYAPAKGD